MVLFCKVMSDLCKYNISRSGILVSKIFHKSILLPFDIFIKLSCFYSKLLCTQYFGHNFRELKCESSGTDDKAQIFVIQGSKIQGIHNLVVFKPNANLINFKLVQVLLSCVGVGVSLGVGDEVVEGHWCFSSLISYVVRIKVQVSPSTSSKLYTQSLF